jgi:hypothetical protein
LSSSKQAFIAEKLEGSKGKVEPAGSKQQAASSEQQAVWQFWIADCGFRIENLRRQRA